MTTGLDWNSRRILGELEKLAPFEKLFMHEARELLRRGGWHIWPSPQSRPSLAQVHLSYMAEITSIKSRAAIVAEAGPLLMVRAMYDALAEHYVEPTYGRDTSVDGDGKVTSANCRAWVIVHSTFMMMQAVIYRYSDIDIFDPSRVPSRDDLKHAVEMFGTDPKRAFDILAAKPTKDLLVDR